MEKKSPAPSPWGTRHHLQLCDLSPSRTLFFIPWNLQDLYFVLPPSWSAPNTPILEFFDSLTSKALLSPVPYHHLQLFHSRSVLHNHTQSLLPSSCPTFSHHTSPSPLPRPPGRPFLFSSLFSPVVLILHDPWFESLFCYIESLQHQSN